MSPFPSFFAFVRLTSLLLLASLSLPQPVAAQDTGELPNLREARRLVFAPRGDVSGEVIEHESLSATDMAILEQLIPTQKYYAAVAIAPGMGLASEATVAAANYHDTENASAAALDGCNERRSSGPECVVVLLIRPEGWQPGAALQLNTDATASLRGDFRRLGRPRVMTISDLTGEWGIGETEAAALAACAQEDCRAVISD